MAIPDGIHKRNREQHARVRPFEEDCRSAFDNESCHVSPRVSYFGFFASIKAE